MIYYKLYNPAGLINQLMSIELAVCIKEITKEDFTIYNIANGSKTNDPIFSASRLYNNRKIAVDNSNGFLITDILDWQNKNSYNLIKEKNYLVAEDCQTIDNLMLYYYDCLENNEDLEFAENRSKIIFSDGMHLKNTLGWYSRFFNNRSKEIDKALLSIKFLPEYYELAEKIANSLGTFNGAHLRLTDHVVQRVNTTKEMFDAGIEKINDSNPIVICTDEPDTQLIKNKKFILLDQYILNNFSDDFMNFKYRDEVSFGLLNNLVMHYSEKFVGTIGSTYSSFIQRGMNQKRDIEWNWFDYLSDPVYEESEPGRYSWNSSTKIATFDKQWFREWKESRII